MYSREGIIQNTNIITVPTVFDASGLKKFRIHKVKKPKRDMQPPKPSFQIAMTSPLSAKPQIMNDVIIMVLSDLKGDPVCSLNPSI